MGVLNQEIHLYYKIIEKKILAELLGVKHALNARWVN